MNLHKWLVGAVVGTVLGVGLWCAVVYFTGWTAGLFAAFLGIFVGMGIAAVAGPDRGSGAALFAAVWALVAVLGGKAAVAWVYAQRHSEGISFGEVTDEYLISCIADEVLADYVLEGYDVDYPAGADLDAPDSEGDYPPSVWEEAEANGSALAPEEQQTFRESIVGDDAHSSLADFLFALIFRVGIFDFLWIGLAVSSAYRIVRNVPAQARKSQQTVLEEPPETFAFLPGLPPPSGAGRGGAAQSIVAGGDPAGGRGSGLEGERVRKVAG